MTTLPRPPRRRPSAEVRPRKYVTAQEVNRLEKAAGSVGRFRERDAAMIRTAFIHGLRVAELVNLRCHHVDLDGRMIQVHRVKGSISGTHPLMKEELGPLRNLMDGRCGAEHVFLSDRGCGMTTSAFHGILARAGVVAGIPFPVNPHSIRHGCGFHLVNEGRDIRVIQGWMGHANIQNTVGYTELSPARFKDFWPDAS